MAIEDFGEMDIDSLDEDYPEEIADLLRSELTYEDEFLEMTTLPMMFEKATERFTDQSAQRYKGGIYERSLVSEGVLQAAPDGEYEAITYGQMRDVVRKLATGLRALGLEHGERIGIFSQTRMEWAHSDFAILAAGGVVTTIYESSSPQQVQYLLDDPGAKGVVVEGQDQLERVLEVINLLNVQFIVTMDEVDEKYTQRDGIYTLGTVYKEGAKRYDPEAYRGWVEAVELDDLASLVYTSGTTGQPKGVRLTHRSLRANVNQAYARMAPREDRPDETLALDSDLETVSFLPLAHIMERLGGSLLLYNIGATIAFAESPETVQEDFETVQPTMSISVPRVYEKMYDAIREEARETEVAGYPVGERIFEWSVDVARDYERESKPGLGLQARMWLANKLVFDEVRESLGGNLEAMVSGGGTLSKDLTTLYHGMGIPVLEGYGMTEASPIVSLVSSENYRAGTIGYPIAGVDIEIDQSIVAEGQFEDAIGEFGELLVKGPQVFDGYWNMPDKTEESFTDDGYFRTGDVVQWRPDGFLVFRERSKQIIVLSTGENVAPAPIEDGFSESEVVEQCMVIGDDEKFVGALIVPNFERIREAAAEEGVDIPADNEAMCRNDRVHEVIQKEVDRVNETFEPHEKIKRFRLVPEEWTEDNGYLTPTLKKKRQKILNEYEHLVEDIYSEDRTDREPEAEAEPAE
jgi:long-chain acyl-CoA synthetase